MLSYRPSTALVVVDVQNDFADPAGSLAIRGGSEVVPVVNREVQAALEAGATIVYTQDWHPPDTPHFAKDGGIWPVHCVQGSWGADFHPELRVEGPVVRKGSHGEDGYSGFTMRDPQTGETRPTELEDLLREHEVEHLVVVGLATDYCVKETALDGRRLGFATTVLGDAIRAVDLQPGDSDRALSELSAVGVELA
jgi:nicotinamidase/pyrazinamidase